MQSGEADADDVGFMGKQGYIYARSCCDQVAAQVLILKVFHVVLAL